MSRTFPARGDRTLRERLPFFPRQIGAAPQDGEGPTASRSDGLTVGAAPGQIRGVGRRATRPVSHARHCREDRSNMAGLDLPTGPAEVLEEIRRPLGRHLGGEHRMRLGGGTALAARWRHRGGARLLCRARRRSPGGNAGAAQVSRARFGPRRQGDASGRTCGTSSHASAPGISNGFFPGVACRSTKSPERSTAPIRAGPRSSPGSTSSRFRPASRMTPSRFRGRPRRRRAPRSSLSKTRRTRTA